MEMEILSERELEKIAYNCKKATMLIEKQQIQCISAMEKFELELHLKGCLACIIYMKQSILINELVRNFFRKHHPDIKLDEGFKKLLKIRIEEHLRQS